MGWKVVRTVVSVHCSCGSAGLPGLPTELSQKSVPYGTFGKELSRATTGTERFGLAARPRRRRISWLRAAIWKRRLGCLLRRYAARVLVVGPVIHLHLLPRELEQSEIRVRPLRRADSSAAPTIDRARTACGNRNRAIVDNTGTVRQPNADHVRSAWQIAEIQPAVRVGGSRQHRGPRDLVGNNVPLQICQGKSISFQNQFA